MVYTCHIRKSLDRTCSICVLQNKMLGTTLLYTLISLFFWKVHTDMSSTPSLKLTCWNGRGYLSAVPYMRQLLNGCDILAVSEHWLHSNRLGVLENISDKHNVFARASKASEAANYGSRRGQGGGGGGGGLLYSGVRIWQGFQWSLMLYMIVRA